MIFRTSFDGSTGGEISKVEYLTLRIKTASSRSNACA